MARPAPAAGEHALVGAVGASMEAGASTGSAGVMEGGRAMRSAFLIASLLLLVALVAQLIRRRRFARSKGGFRCKARLSARRSMLWPRLRPRWTRRRLWARWMGDELLVWRGRVLMRTVRLPAKVRNDGIYLLTCLDVTQLGSQPIAIELEISDGSRIEVAARSS